MRKTIYCCLFALLGTSCLAGCTFVQNFRRNGCGDSNRCAQGCAAPKKTAAAIEAARRDDSAYAKASARPRPGLLMFAGGTPTKAKAPALGDAATPIASARGTTPQMRIETAPLPLPRDLANEPSEPAPIDIEVVAMSPIHSAANFTEEPPTAAHPPAPVLPAREVVGDAATLRETVVADKEVHITYGQTDQFRTVTGLVQQFRKTWRLRYAAVDQEDRFGGVVVLEGGAELNRLREGKHVRVTGQLIPPEDRTSSARYRVTTVEVLD